MQLILSGLLIVACTSLNGMARYEDTDEDLQFGRTQERSANEQTHESELSILYCGGCGSDATTTCAQCAGVYYCSRDCQINCWPNHKAACKKIALAHIGDLKQIENFYNAWLITANETQKVEPIEQAFDWLMRLIVRLAQDGACTIDPQIDLESLMARSFKLMTKLSTIDTTDPVAIARLAYLKHHPLNIHKALAWARTITDNDQLVTPLGLAAYLGKEKMVIDPRLWKKERLRVLDEMAKLDI